MHNRPASEHRRATAVIYDFSHFGRHRLRAPNATIIDLPIAMSRTSTQVWVATIWPDPHAPAGWARQLWELDPNTGRGWILPQELAAGDVIEFGADTPERAIRWYGIMDSYEVDRWATLQGPYDHPVAAYDDAQRLLALERYATPLQSEPTRTPERRARPTRERRHLGPHERPRRGSDPI